MSDRCKHKIITIQGLRLWIYYGLNHGQKKPPYLVRTPKQSERANDGRAPV